MSHRFEVASTAVVNEEESESVEARDEAAVNERNAVVAEELDGNGAAEHLLDIRADDRDLHHEVNEERLVGREVKLGALGEIIARNNPNSRRQVLEQQPNQYGGEQHPHERIAGVSASLGVQGSVRSVPWAV